MKDSIWQWIDDIIIENGKLGHEMNEFGKYGDDAVTYFRRVMKDKGFDIRMGNGNVFYVKPTSGGFTVIHQRALASRIVKPVFI